MRYYKNKYAIAVCENDETENIIALFDNAQDFANKLHIEITKARDLLSKHYKGVAGNYFNYKGTWAKLEFVNMVEEL